MSTKNESVFPSTACAWNDLDSFLKREQLLSMMDVDDHKSLANNEQDQLMSINHFYTNSAHRLRMYEEISEMAGGIPLYLLTRKQFSDLKMLRRMFKNRASAGRSRNKTKHRNNLNMYDNKAYYTEIYQMLSVMETCLTTHQSSISLQTEFHRLKQMILDSLTTGQKLYNLHSRRMFDFTTKQKTKKR